MLKRKHDRDNAFNNKKSDEKKGKREDAAQRRQKHHDADCNRKDRRHERPPEPRCSAHHEGCDGTDESADEEQPAKQKLDSERSNRWNNDGGETKNDKNYPLAQKNPPIYMDELPHT